MSILDEEKHQSDISDLEEIEKPMSFQKKLSAKEFVVLAEMHTPKGVNVSKLVSLCD